MAVARGIKENSPIKNHPKMKSLRLTISRLQFQGRRREGRRLD